MKRIFLAVAALASTFMFTSCEEEGSIFNIQDEIKKVENIENEVKSGVYFEVEKGTIVYEYSEDGSDKVTMTLTFDQYGKVFATKTKKTDLNADAIVFVKDGNQYSYLLSNDPLFPEESKVCEVTTFNSTKYLENAFMVFRGYYFNLYATYSKYLPEEENKPIITKSTEKYAGVDCDSYVWENFSKNGPAKMAGWKRLMFHSEIEGVVLDAVSFSENFDASLCEVPEGYTIQEK